MARRGRYFLKGAEPRSDAVHHMRLIYLAAAAITACKQFGVASLGVSTGYLEEIYLNAEQIRSNFYICHQ